MREREKERESWLIHVVVQQKVTQNSKAIIVQLRKKKITFDPAEKLSGS